MNEQTHSSRPCPECGGPRAMTTLNITVPIGEEGSELKLKQPNRVIGLGGLFAGKSNKSDVATVSCTNCGYTTLYATQPRNLIPDEE